ncbi:MAG: RnfABCDGE type electron transport complex subunit G [bacterium]
MRDILELIVVLTAICLIAALGLAKVNDITKEPIALQKRIAKMQAVKAVLPPHDNEPDQHTVDITSQTAGGKEDTVVVYRGMQDGRVTGLAFEMTSLGFGGPITLMMGLHTDGTIQGIEIISMSETPGLGARITEPNFKGQFQGKSLQTSRIQLKKDGGDLDQVTGATISPRAVVQAVRNGLEWYGTHSRQILQ